MEQVITGGLDDADLETFLETYLPILVVDHYTTDARRQAHYLRRLDALELNILKILQKHEIAGSSLPEAKSELGDNKESQSDILSALKQGEGQRVEFKRSFAESDEAISSLCAFAHSEGGTVYFGIDQSKGVTGVSLGHNTIEGFVNKLRASTDPPMSPSVETLTLLGCSVVAVKVGRAAQGEVVFVNGQALVRVGKTNQKMSPGEIRARLFQGAKTEKGQSKAQPRAILTARIQERSSGNYRLVIENAGDGEARDVRLTMDGQAFESHPVSVSGEGHISIIGPHSQATRLLAITFGHAPPFEFEASWQDDSGEGGRYRTTLTF